MGNAIEKLSKNVSTVRFTHLYGPLPGFEVLLSRLDASEVRAEVDVGADSCCWAVRCSVLEFELATLLLERLRRLFSESPRLTTPLPVIEKCLSL